MISTVVWGDGSIARDAIRAVDAHPALTLTAVVATDADRAGRDAGDLAGLGRPLGVLATGDAAAVLEARPDAVVYAGSGRVRPVDVRADIVAALRAGAVVLTPPIHPIYDHRGSEHGVREEILTSIRDGGGRLHVGDVDVDWADHVLPLALRSIGDRATSVRVTETVDYSTHDLPGSVRYLMGMGEPLSFLPPMLAPRMPTTVWGDRVRQLARVLRVELDEIREVVERVELEVTVETATMGKFEAGGMGAVRFEVQGWASGAPAVVVEHVGRIDAEVAPEWPHPPAGGAGHTVLVDGDPRIAVIVEPGPRSGGETAVDRLVARIDALVGREPGVYDDVDLLRP
ncbi:dihydrodipicolinate reductase [Rhodococcus gannanensis]|uniref:Dihydrodipicolinate reductase n=1 Tax=Rhodococcus gannanensis TaxID=1960308 RepID=A0ABW4PC39_9NOCA